MHEFYFAGLRGLAPSVANVVASIVVGSASLSFDVSDTFYPFSISGVSGDTSEPFAGCYLGSLLSSAAGVMPHLRFSSSMLASSPGFSSSPVWVSFTLIRCAHYSPSSPLLPGGSSYMCASSSYNEWVMGMRPLPASLYEAVHP